jgi:hypothetical protein
VTLVPNPVLLPLQTEDHAVTGVKLALAISENRVAIESERDCPAVWRRHSDKAEFAFDGMGAKWGAFVRNRAIRAPFLERGRAFFSLVPGRLVVLMWVWL